ncbi:Leukocyte receptor cluster member 8-like [Cricetulus griseus]|uniref:Leukocyte receptor cluster member 8-like n=1 Tax=Cricetulus griseus TaxID=10029 RepID=G3I8V3_CRIGR|nr:Leukocyte receptor cluster member 8-like [Cricetulus griseus]
MVAGASKENGMEIPMHKNPEWQKAHQALASISKAEAASSSKAAVGLWPVHNMSLWQSESASQQQQQYYQWYQQYNYACPFSSYAMSTCQSYSAPTTTSMRWTAPEARYSPAAVSSPAPRDSERNLQSPGMDEKYKTFCGAVLHHLRVRRGQGLDREVAQGGVTGPAPDGSAYTINWNHEALSALTRENVAEGPKKKQWEALSSLHPPSGVVSVTRAGVSNPDEGHLRLRVLAWGSASQSSATATSSRNTIAPELLQRETLSQKPKKKKKRRKRKKYNSSSFSTDSRSHPSSRSSTPYSRRSDTHADSDSSYSGNECHPVGHRILFPKGQGGCGVHMDGTETGDSVDMTQLPPNATTRRQQATLEREDPGSELKKQKRAVHFQHGHLLYLCLKPLVLQMSNLESSGADPDWQGLQTAATSPDITKHHLHLTCAPDPPMVPPVTVKVV